MHLSHCWLIIWLIIHRPILQFCCAVASIIRCLWEKVHKRCKTFLSPHRCPVLSPKRTLRQYFFSSHQWRWAPRRGCRPSWWQRTCCGRRRGCWPASCCRSARWGWRGTRREWCRWKEAWNVNCYNGKSWPYDPCTTDTEWEGSASPDKV